MFDPRDVKVAALTSGGLAIGASTNFAAPANNIATRNRYLLAFQCDQEATFTANAFALEDINGNLLIRASVWTNEVFTLIGQPLLVGVPGANGLRITNVGPTAGKSCSAWVMFADIQGAIVPAFAVTI